MKCLVTGGCGFIGSHLANRLLELGHYVTVIDDASAGDSSRLHRGIRYACRSITSKSSLNILTEGVDVIFHLAAIPSIEQSVEDPIGTHNVNVIGTLNVLMAAKRNKVKRIIFSSSSSVYGDQDTHIMREEMIPNPKSPYGLHKLNGEQYADMFAELHGIHTISLRYFNVYGPGQPNRGAYSLVIPKFLQMKDDGEPLTVYGDGEQTRDYTHVSDVVRANILAMDVPLSPNNKHIVVNIGTGIETSVNQIAQMIGGPINYIVPNPRQNFEENRKAADLTRAEQILGWRPEILFTDGIKEFLR